MLLINPRIVILQGTGSQVTLGFPHSQIRLRVASPKVRERGCTTPIAYELASDTYYGLGVMTRIVVVEDAGRYRVVKHGSRVHCKYPRCEGSKVASDAAFGNRI